MGKYIVPKRFSRNFINEETFQRFNTFLGPIQNFIGGSTIQYLNLRILIDERSKKFRIVNDYDHKYKYKISEYLKGFFRTYSDGIFTTDSHVSKNSGDDFEIDYEDLKLDREIFFKITSLKEGKKPIGILSKDINLNLLQKHKLFLNENFIKYLYVKPNKLEKVEKISSSMNLDLNNLENIEIKQLENLNIKSALDKFHNDSKSNFTFLEGITDQSLKFLSLRDPNEIPTDILVIAFVKDGEYNQQELSRPFDIWHTMEKNYVKLFQSKKFMGNEGSTWFFSVFKKRMLILKDREVLDLKLENPLFDEKTFKNYF